ncbi:MAG: 1-acyl-sn-glycerol-3-phosphate acyltransferase [Deltaproteobacteria bacterium]|nr:1-acyl-sn-glycerol-3-phosphate acyltransferase [Deltaproteobacteria bacterium]MCX7952486.1 1-acyl-sn-glycerol-3-phosphate acyltransferase [Deltaproteobacteria bacterium]
MQRALLNLCFACHSILYHLTGCFVKKSYLNLDHDLSADMEIYLPTKNLPLVVVSNHQSAFDISSIVLSFPKRRIFFVAKKELLWTPTISVFIKRYNGIPIDRSAPSEAIRIISEKVADLITTVPLEELGIAIFPEGTRSKDGNLKNFKSTGLSVCLTALKKACIVPVVFTENHKFGKIGHNNCQSEMIMLKPEIFDASLHDPSLFIDKIFENMLNTFDCYRSRKIYKI